MTDDKIFLRNVHADILIGINPEEREVRQPVIVNATLYTDCASAAQSDRIEDAVDYSVLHDRMVDHMNSTHYDLIETLVEKLAQLCLDDSRVKKCIVSVDKPEALEYAESVAIEITRSQK
jgi:FolB domain-containing protein